MFLEALLDELPLPSVSRDARLKNEMFGKKLPLKKCLLNANRRVTLNFVCETLNGIVRTILLINKHYRYYML